MPLAFECEKCHSEIDYKGRVQVLDPQGFTHSFCGRCGGGFKKKIEDSNSSIAETGKMGHLKNPHPSSNVSFGFFGK